MISDILLFYRSGRLGACRACKRYFLCKMCSPESDFILAYYDGDWVVGIFGSILYNIDDIAEWI